jgi:plasmid stabilization system protein ParE
VEFEIVWTDPALTSLQEIHTYLAQFNPAAAERISGAIIKKVELLKSVPKMGAHYPTKRLARTLPYRRGGKVSRLLSGY